MAIAFSKETTQDIIQNLEAAYAQAKRNGLPEVAAQHYATGGMHDLLTVINRRWQDVKDTEAMNVRLHPPGTFAQLLPYIADLIQNGFAIYVYRGREWLDARVIEPTGRWQVGYLHMGNAACSAGGPHLQAHEAVEVESYHTAGYLLTAEDWQRITDEYAAWREQDCWSASGTFSLGGRPWYVGASSLERYTNCT